MMQRKLWPVMVMALVAACSDDAPPTTGSDVSMDAEASLPPDTTTLPDVVDLDQGMDASLDTAADVCSDVLPDGACTPSCDAGDRVCDGVCVGRMDPGYGCAGPGCAPCSFANATAVCRDGACAFGACNMGYADCDRNPANGCEVNLAADPMNCGTCGRTCSIPNGVAGCAMGVCTVGTCNAGFGDCDHLAANGCELPVTADVMNCGGCGTACTVANATAACAAGACAVASCNAGFGDCDMMATNGCETRTSTDVANCGTCGATCRLANATAACAAGACAVTECAESFGNCDLMAANGCEADLRTSAAHCGACGLPCRPPNATGACRAGICVIDRCNAGFTDCDGDSGNGCETDTAGSVANCGACGRGCDVPNATPACRAGVCGVGACSPGFLDCDGSSANGCEINGNVSTSNCGACGRACSISHATAQCVEGRCQVESCSPGYADCNASVTDGCEAPLATDVNDCGGCGEVCRFPHATPRCVAGVCGILSCESGFGDCDGDIGNGCETDLLRDPSYCGSCRAAPCSEVCLNGSCAGCTPATAGRACTGARTCSCSGGTCGCN